MKLLCITCIAVIVVKIIVAKENKIIDYFDSDTFKTIQNHWQTERKSFENALSLILQQDYSFGGMNVYVRSLPDSFKISDGFYVSDNVVHLIILETRLNMLPIMVDPEVTFALASNYLHIEAGLERMILNTNYLLIRNQSDVVFMAAEQDAYQKSPFSFQQVQDAGEMTIIAQDCKLVGYTISTLSANTVNLGLDTFKVTNCKFSIEIYSSGLGSPPVFAPYFSEQQSIAIETMLSNPIRAELLPKLQAAVFTYVNTSGIFGDKLPQLRFHQNNLFKQTSDYMSGLVRKFVQNTIKKTQGVLQLKPLELLWNKTCINETCGSCVRLKDVVLYGLDTAYSAHIGGPFKLQSPKVAEAIRFSTMQVRGKIFFENETVQGEHDFAVELTDVAVNVEMEAKLSSFVMVPKKIHVLGWRSLEFSILELHILRHERRASQSLITGYLVNEIPRSIFNHISKTFGDFKNENEQDFYKTDSDKNDPRSKKIDKNKKQKKEKNTNAHQNDSNQSDSHQSDAHQSDFHQSDGHQSDSHQSDAHQSDSHQSDAHQNDAHQSDSHQSDAHQNDAHQSDSHQNDAHQSDSHKSDAHQSDAHPSDSHQSDAHQSDAHQSDVHQSDAHQSDAHQSDVHQSDAHQSDVNQNDAHQSDSSEHKPERLSEQSVEAGRHSDAQAGNDTKTDSDTQNLSNPSENEIKY